MTRLLIVQNDNGTLEKGQMFTKCIGQAETALKGWYI